MVTIHIKNGGSYSLKMKAEMRLSLVLVTMAILYRKKGNHVVKWTADIS